MGTVSKSSQDIGVKQGVNPKRVLRERGDAAHVFTLGDIQARFADVVSLAETAEYLDGLLAQQTS